MKILTGTVLSCIISTLAISPALANQSRGSFTVAQLPTEYETLGTTVAPGTEMATDTPLNEAIGQEITGRIETIEDDQVTIRTTTGMTLVLRVDPDTISALNMAPGKNILVNYGDLRVGVIQNATKNTNVGVDLLNGEVETYLINRIARETVVIQTPVVVNSREVVSRLSNFELDASQITVVEPIQIAAQLPPSPPPATPLPPQPAPAPQAAPPAPAPAPQPVEALW